MQEKLKIFSSDGEIAIERDLDGVDIPLMLLAGDKPELVETVPPGAEVLGALVRDEDGWTLASAKADVPVTSGPKSGSDFHLTAGVPCALGKFIFRIEREGAATGTVLVWRIGSSQFAADPLLPGRNLVAADHDGAYTVNPAIGGDELCSIFPTADGVDVACADNSAQRLAVPFATLFAVGKFQGMALSAADAAKAVASGHPFSWPARSTRTGLMTMLLICGIASLGAISLAKRTRQVEELIAQKTGPEIIERHLVDLDDLNTDEDALVYENSFYRSLPLVLTAERSPIIPDLERRARQILDRAGGAKAADGKKLIKSMLAFLQAIDSIQLSVHRGDWQELKATLAAADREMFTRCNADLFYSDAQEVADFVTDVLPKFFIAVANFDEESFKDAEKRLSAFFDGLKDNMFMSGEIVRRERDSAQTRWDALSVYLKARKAFLASPDGTCGDLRDAWADLVDAFDSEGSVFDTMITNERDRLTAAILERASNASPSTLVNLCSLGETVGVAPAKLDEWRARAVEIRRNIFAQYRELYSDYRMRAAVAPDAPETLAVLDDMIALGLDENRFHKWALREKARVASVKEQVKEEINEEEGTEEEAKEEAGAHVAEEAIEEAKDQEAQPAVAEAPQPAAEADTESAQPAAEPAAEAKTNHEGESK